MDFETMRRADGKPGKFSRIELRDILVSIVVLSLAFMLMFRNSSFIKPFFTHYFGSAWAVGMFGIMVVLVFLSFMLHEFGHKFTAQRMGLWSEYRMFPMGLLVALLMGFVGFLFAAPGVVYIRGWVSEEQDGKISLAGPVVNIVLAIIGLAGCFTFNGEMMVVPFYLLFTLNSALALFNLLPIGILDGSKIMKWDTGTWLLFFAVAAVLFGSRFVGILPDLYYIIG